LEGLEESHEELRIAQNFLRHVPKAKQTCALQCEEMSF
jgi:hypothetical protein